MIISDSWSLPDKLKIYDVDIDYLSYLHSFDNQVELKGNRPYIGIIANINNYFYFLPLTSDDKPYLRENRKYKRIVVDISKDDKLGFVRVGNMIPVPKGCFKEKSFNSSKDRDLLRKQYRVFVTQEFRDRLRLKIINLYNTRILNPDHYLNDIICNFPLLEQKCNEYKS